MLLSRIFEKLSSFSNLEFALTRDVTRIEIHFAKLNSDFVVKRTLITPALTFSTVLEAKQQDVNLILTPDSLFAGEMRSLEYHQVDIWRILLNQRISIIHLGSEWLNSNNGFAIAISNQLGLDPVDLFTIQDPARNEKIPVGRIAAFKYPFEADFVKFLDQHFPGGQMLYRPEVKTSISNIAIIPARNISSDIIYHAIECGCGAVIGGDFTASGIQAANATGIYAYALTFPTILERGLKSLLQILAMEYPNDEFSYFASKS